MFSRLVNYAIVAVVTAAAFAAACSFGLGFCDDTLYISEEPMVTGGLSLDAIKFAFTEVSQAIWMPLVYLSYMFDFSVGWGYGGMHAHSILWHVADAVLLYAVLLRLFGSRPAAVLGALVWSIHPLRVESVVWLASRKDVISTFFFLLAIYAWVRAGRRGYGWMCLSFAMVAAGAMAKPSVMVFPVFALAIDYGITGARKEKQAYWAVVGLAAVIALEAQVLQVKGHATGYSALIPLWYRLLNALAALTVYLGNFIYPDKLAPQCMIRFPDMPRFSATGAVALAAALLWGAKAMLPRCREYMRSHDAELLFKGGRVENAALAGAAIFFSSLAPFLGISGFGYHAFADRFTLLPAIGLSMALASILGSALSGRRRLGRWAAVAVSAFAAAVFLRTRDQTSLWSDNIRLMEHTLEVDRDNNIDIHRGLAVQHWKGDHDMEKVYRHMRKCWDYCWCDQVRDGMGISVCLLVEACYDTGRHEEGDEFYQWLKGWTWRRNKARTAEFLMAKAMFDLNLKTPLAVEYAEKTLEEIKALAPGSYIAHDVAYRIALRKGDRAAIKAALEECAGEPVDASCSCAAWASRLLRDFSPSE